MDTSDIPAGYINILSTKQNDLNKNSYLNMKILRGFGFLIQIIAQKSAIINNTTSNLKRYWCPDQRQI